MAAEGKCNRKFADCLCVYESLEAPCKLCKERGLSCGTEEKTLGPKTQSKQATTQSLRYDGGYSIALLDRPVGSPGDISFTGVEALYIQGLFCRRWSRPFTRSYDVHTLSPVDDVLKQRVAFLLLTAGSKPVRYAALACAISILDNENTHTKLQYLALCYKELQKAISISALVDIVYASHFLAGLALRHNESIDTLLAHIVGISQALKNLRNTPSVLSPQEWLGMENMCLAILDRWVTTIVRNFFLQSAFTPQIEKIFVKVRSYYSISSISIDPFMQQSAVLRSHCRFRRLQLSFNYYFIYFLSRINRLPRNESLNEEIACELRRVVQELIHLLHELNSLSNYDVQNLEKINLNDFARPFPHQLPKTEGIEHYFLHFTLQLIKNMLLSKHSIESDNMAMVSALSVCRACPSRAFDGHLGLRNLFLAGLVLTSSRHPTGTSFLKLRIAYFKANAWIRNWIRSYDGQWPISDHKIPSVFALLDGADRCSSMRDVWSLECGDLSVAEFFLSFPGILSWY